MDHKIQLQSINPDLPITIQNVEFREDEKELIIRENAVLQNVKAVIVEEKAAAATTAIDEPFEVPTDTSKYEIHKTEHGIYWKVRKKN